jgi:hypothetical protein
LIRSPNTVNVPNSFKITYRLFRGDTSDSDPDNSQNYRRALSRG